MILGFEVQRKKATSRVGCKSRRSRVKLTEIEQKMFDVVGRAHDGFERRPVDHDSAFVFNMADMILDFISMRHDATDNGTWFITRGLGAAEGSDRLVRHLGWFVVACQFVEAWLWVSQSQTGTKFQFEKAAVARQFRKHVETCWFRPINK